jgi:hypothetical protein
MALPEELQSYPEAFADIAERVNALLVFGKTVESMEGKGGIKVSVSDRRMVIDGSAPPDDTGGGTGGGTGLPSGSAGDMLYHNGTDWVSLDAPSVSSANPVLRHNGTAPYWEEPEGCV